ncbi:unnamed protein product, partial [Ectocarpus fasciculatus]
QDGSCHRQLSDFCRRDLIPQVAAVCRFRNAHSPRPYLSQRIHATCEQETHSISKCSNSSSRRRRRRRRTPSRTAHWPAAAESNCRRSSSSNRCSSSTVVVSGGGADGRVEVRAAAGNARLTLSASGTVAEVDYAVALPPGPGAAPPAPDPAWPTPPAAAAAAAAAAVWVTRRFLAVGSAPPFDDVPPEFSHALSLAVGALRCDAPAAVETGSSSRSGRSGGESALGRVGPAAAAAGGTVSGEGGEGGLVAVELPRPEERPDHASWDTVRQWPGLDSDGDLPAPLGYYNSDRRWRDGAAPTFAARAATASAAAAVTRCRLLSVDVMKLAEGQGYAGELAAVVESTACCTYRVVVGDGGRRRGTGEGSSVGVHVVVHADGTEVWLEGDFVRLVRPPAAAAQQPPPPQQLLLHAAVGVPGIDLGVPATTAAAEAAVEAGGWTSMSLGDIASRAIALRRQFLRCSASRALGGRRAGGHQDMVKVRPPLALVQPPAALSSPSPSAEAVVRNVAAARPAPTEVSAAAGAGAANRWLGSPSSRGGMATESSSSMSVVESVERGGASFVAFVDGRARGAFADRTIVSLGAPFFYRPLTGSRCGAGGVSYYGSGGREGVATAAVEPGCSEDEEEEEEDREIECIRADGTVLRLTRRSLDRRGSFGRRSCAPLRQPAIGTATLRPYIVAVLRFADWAATPPADRRAAAERESAGRAAAAAEAERNRRFVDLQLLAGKQSVAPRPLPCYHGGSGPRKHCDGSPFGATGSRRGGRRSGDEANASPGFRRLAGVGSEEKDDSQHKENNTPPRRPSDRVGVAKGGSGVSRWGVRDGGRERNSLVAGLLEANRNVLMGEDMSRKFARGDLLL